MGEELVGGGIAVALIGVIMALVKVVGNLTTKRSAKSQRVQTENGRVIMSREESVKLLSDIDRHVRQGHQDIRDDAREISHQQEATALAVGQLTGEIKELAVENRKLAGQQEKVVDALHRVLDEGERSHDKLEEKLEGIGDRLLVLQTKVS